jgi:phosphoenolpyruvate carboxykinase (GTP)
MTKREVESWVADIAGHLKPAAKWVVDRIAGCAPASVTPIGNLPADSGFDASGLDLDASTRAALFSLDPRSWLAELEQNRAFLRTFGDRMPAASTREHDGLRSRLCASIS